MPESLFYKVVGLKPATLLKKRLWYWCFPVNFAKFLRKPFLQNTSGQLLLFLLTLLLKISFKFFKNFSLIFVIDIKHYQVCVTFLFNFSYQNYVKISLFIIPQSGLRCPTFYILDLCIMPLVKARLQISLLILSEFK